MSCTHDAPIGNTGSPILRQEDLVSIGAHVYGGALNSASVIGGKYGNRYTDYLAVFDSAMPPKALQWVPTESSGPATESGILSPRVRVNVSHDEARVIEPKSEEKRLKPKPAGGSTTFAQLSESIPTSTD